MVDKFTAYSVHSAKSTSAEVHVGSQPSPFGRNVRYCGETVCVRDPPGNSTVIVTSAAVKSRKKTALQGPGAEQATERSPTPWEDALMVVPAGTAVENLTSRPDSQPIVVHALHDVDTTTTRGISKKNPAGIRAMRDTAHLHVDYSALIGLNVSPSNGSR